jgi:hypothetical protein
MALDKDGTLMYYINTANSFSALTNAQVISLNDETNTAYAPGGGTIVAIFPELRDINGYYLLNNDNTGRGAAGGWNSIQVSTDTTNGLDGTWVTIATNVALGGASNVNPAYRTSITATTQTGVKALRGYAAAGGNYTAFHVYGKPSTGQNPNRLALWHPTLDQEIGGAYFDWGNVPQNTIADRQFRVKNLSSTLTANNINLSLDALSDTTPTTVSQHLFSPDGTTFSGTLAIGNLAPSSISGVLTLRRNISNAATLSIWALRINANASSWS